MIRKLLIVAGGLAVLGVILAGTEVASYVRTSAGYAAQAAKESVPVEFEIDRARHMIEGLVPEIRKNMYVIAREEVEVRKLQEQVDDTAGRLAKEKDQLMKLKTDLTSGQDVFHYAGRSYSEAQVKTDLANRFERYKTGDATLASLQQILDARTRSLEAARKRLDGMLATKRQLQVDVENLDARMQMVAAAQATSQYQFDDSRLGRVKEHIAELRTRLEVAERLANAESEYQGEIPVDATSPETIVDQVTEYFSAERPTQVAAVDAPEAELIQ